MNQFATKIALSALLSTFAAAQGQTLTFGVNPGQTTTGSGTIGVTVNVPGGTSSAGVTTALANALTGQGYTVQQNGTEITVTSGPGGAPLQNGGGIGSTDPGVNGVRATVHKAPPQGPGPNPNPPGNKVNGGKVPKARGGGQAQGPGSIQVDVEVQKLVNGQWTLMWIQVVVPIQPGDDANAINQRVRQQLENQGFKVNDVTLPPVVQPITPVPCIGLDRTFNGESVQSIQFDFFGSAQNFFPESWAGAGQFPISGVTDWDIGLRPDGSESPYFIEYNGSHQPGGNGFFAAFVQPGTVGAFQIGFGSSLDPWNPLAIPLPLVGPDFYSVLDPFSSLSQLAFPDPLGLMQMPLVIPPDPQLQGLELQLQGLTIDPAQPNVPGSVERTQGLLVAIGQ